MLSPEGSFLGRSDLGYERLRLAIEYLGSVHALALEADWQRQNTVTLGGYLSLGVTSRSLCDPAALVMSVMRAAKHQHQALGLPGPFCFD
jgi:very-short-patch-repair endonuclease